MNEPSPTPDTASSWGLIFHGSGTSRPSHTRAEWARIADAIRTADRDLNPPASRGDPAGHRMRGDAYWCHVAVDTYRMLDAAGAYWHMTPGERSECYADDDLIRAWLDAPWVPPGDEPQTMLQAGGLDVEFEAGRLPDPASMTILVGLAQDAGVFGIPQHRVNLWRYFGDGTMPAHTFTVTVRPPDGPGWASSFVGADHLLPPTRSPIDAIAGVLQGVAGVANRLLAARDGPPDPVPHQALTQIAEADPLPPGVQGFPVGNPGRTFPPLRLVHGATSVGAADQSPQVRDSGRHR